MQTIQERTQIENQAMKEKLDEYSSLLDGEQERKNDIDRMVSWIIAIAIGAFFLIAYFVDRGVIV